MQAVLHAGSHANMGFHHRFGCRLCCERLLHWWRSQLDDLIGSLMASRPTYAAHAAVMMHDVAEHLVSMFAMVSEASATSCTNMCMHTCQLGAKTLLTNACTLLPGPRLLTSVQLSSDTLLQVLWSVSAGCRSISRKVFPRHLVRSIAKSLPVYNPCVTA